MHLISKDFFPLKQIENHLKIAYITQKTAVRNS